MASVLGRTRLLGGCVSRAGAALKSSQATAAAAADTMADSLQPVPAPPSAAAKSGPDPLDLTFEDSQKAFQSKTTWEVLRAYVVFALCSSSYLVESNMKLMRFGQRLLGKSLFESLMKSTFYGHFVAGEDQKTIQPVIERMRSFGVKSILDYSVEEDLSAQEAEEKEMTSCVSAAGDSTEEEGAIRKFHAHREFADRRYRVEGARTYFYMNEAQCERNMDVFLRCIEAVSGVTNCTGFAAIKLTALGRPQLLLQLSEAILRIRRYISEVSGKAGSVMEQHVQPEQLQKAFSQAAILKDTQVQQWLQHMTYDECGLINVLPWNWIIDAQGDLRQVFRVPDLHSGELKQVIDSHLTEKEEEMFRNMMRRLHTIFQVAASLDVRVMVDAEQTYFQPAISRITLEMMAKYNKKKAIVFNTYQCYLKDAHRSVVMDLEQAERQKFFFGAKLVRGAYMEQERVRAVALGYEDPVHATYEDTSASYERTLLECLRRIRSLKDRGDEKKVAVMVASHNEDTVRFTIQKMKELDISPADKVICFGQLYGMCDQVSFLLGQAGYSVYKYVPYGPVGEVLPYLSRRAYENRGILHKIRKERRLQFEELRRRILGGQFFYVPKGNYHPV